MKYAIFRMWFDTALIGLVIAGMWSLYIGYQGISPLSYVGISKIFAATGTILFAFSFALSPICYFYDFADRKIALRKQFGLWGYYCALVYSTLLLCSDLDFYFFGFFANFFSADIFFGVLAMMILTVMAIISNIPMMKMLGQTLWRRILRLGYVAYACLVIRAVWIEWDLWSVWFEAMDGLPPIRIPLCIIATTVLIFRAAMGWSLWHRGKLKEKEAASK